MKKMNTLKVSKEVAAKIVQLGEVKSDLATLKKSRETIEAELLDLAGGEEVIFQSAGKDGAILGRVYQDFWKGLDQKKLWADYPAEAALCKSVKPYLAIEVF